MQVKVANAANFGDGVSALGVSLAEPRGRSDADHRSVADKEHPFRRIPRDLGDRCTDQATDMVVSHSSAAATARQSSSPTIETMFEGWEEEFTPSMRRDFDRPRKVLVDLGGDAHSQRGLPARSDPDAGQDRWPESDDHSVGRTIGLGAQRRWRVDRPGVVCPGHGQWARPVTGHAVVPGEALTERDPPTPS